MYKVLLSLLYIINSLIPSFFIYCISGDEGVFIYSVGLLLLASLGLFTLKQSENNVQEKIIKYGLISSIIFIVFLFLHLKISINQQIGSVIDILIAKLFDVLTFFKGFPNSNCTIICDFLVNYLNKDIVYIIVTFILVCFMLKTSLKVANLWIKKEK